MKRPAVLGPLVVPFTLGLVGAPSALAAPPPSYGGELVAYVLGGPLSLGHGEPRSLAEATLRAAVFEPLYAQDDQGTVLPILADGPPRLEGTTALIPIRAQVVLHDGRLLTAERVIAALVAKDGPAESWWFLAGRTPAERRASIQLHPSGSAVQLTLMAPFPDLARALAAPGRGLDFGGNGLAVGSGPFRVEQPVGEGPRLLPFLGHRDGRPYVDALTFRRLASRAGVVSLLRRGEATVLFGAAERGHGAPSPDEVLVLDAGAAPLLGLDAAQHHDLFDAILERERIVQRFFPEDTRSARRLDGATGPAATSQAPAIPPGAKLTLRVEKDTPVPLRFLERLQLDLLRRGLTVTLAREPGDARALGLEWEIVWAGPDADPIDRLSQLVAVARRHGRPLPLSPEQAATFISATRDARATQVEALEQALRRSAGLVPIAARRIAVGLRPDLLGVRTPLQDALHFPDAQLPEAP